MSELAGLAGRLQQAALHPPGLAALESAARRAAEATNQQLSAAHVPARAEVVRIGQGFRVNLVQTGRIDRPFTGRTPRELLALNVRKEMQLARSEIATEARKALLP